VKWSASCVKIPTTVAGELTLLAELERPSWFAYPAAFLRFAGTGIHRFAPWRFLEPEYVLSRMKGLSERFLNRTLLPFALRTDCADVACWEYEKGSVVVVIHDFADPGWEQVGEFENFWSWFRSAVEDFATFEND
jgi:hypothetical protein